MKRQFKTIEAKKQRILPIITKYADVVGTIEATLPEEIILVSSIQVSKLSGKLTGYYSVSTSVKRNIFCQARCKHDEMICHDCYAVTNLERYDALSQNLDINFDIMNRFLISETAWATLCIPTTNGDARIESHGDVNSVTCARNYIRIIRTHKHLNFGVWTKNWNIWYSAFQLENGKPDNMTFIVSSAKLNTVMDLPEKIRPYVDHVFTVYDDEYITANNVTINCGARDCAGCRKCYRKDSDFYISEKKK